MGTSRQGLALRLTPFPPGGSCLVLLGLQLQPLPEFAIGLKDPTSEGSPRRCPCQ